MTTFLVTGGAGFIGSHLATRLVDDGHQVRVLDDFSTGHRQNLAAIEGRIELIEGDICHSHAVAEAVDGVDAVFHLAALPSVSYSLANPLKTHHASATGTITLLDACRKSNVRRVVYAASSSAYGDRSADSLVETALQRPLSPYAAAKLASEMYCEAFAHSYGIETIRLRYFNVFGPRQNAESRYSAVIPMFISSLLRDVQPVIYGDGLQSRDFTYVENIVEANILAVSAEGVSGKVYNAACGQSTSVLTLLQTICRLLGKPYEPQFEAARSGDIRHSLADISAANRDLGYQVRVSFIDGLQKTIDSYLELTSPTTQRASA